MMKQSTNPLGIAKLSNLLGKVKLELDAEQIADILWLTTQIGEVEKTHISETQVEESKIFPKNIIDNKLVESSSPNIVPSQPSTPAYLPNSSSGHSQSKPVSEGIPFQAPAAPALRNSLELARALRPLMRKVPSQTKTVLDEEETVTQSVERKFCIPVLKPAPERWLDVALVIEESRSNVIWRQIIAEFQKLLELQGAFRYVRTWGLKADSDNNIKLFIQQKSSLNEPYYRSEKELLEPSGRRLILLVSDCISPLWRQETFYKFLQRVSDAQPLAVVQLLPEKLWVRTALGAGFPVQLSALLPGVANNQLMVDGLPVWEEVDVANAVTLPIITLEPDSFKQWSRVVAGIGSSRTAGVLFDLALVASLAESFSTNNAEFSAEDLVKRFRTTASPTARRLAGLIAAVPISLPVVYLVQQTLLKESMQVHVAEVFMSGLLRPINYDISNYKTNSIQYEFVEGVRELLIDSVPISDVDTVLEAVSQYIANKLGISITSFTALLSSQANWDKATKEQVMPFAKIATQVLKRLGGEYAALAIQLESPIIAKVPEQESGFLLPNRRSFTFEVALVVFEDEIELASAIDLQPFEFEVAIIESKQTGLFRRKTELAIKRTRQQAWGYSEDLGNGVQLEMVAIPEGTFIMGSPPKELEHQDDESPQHQVTLKSFFMGKYPVTQAQWKAVAALPQINQELDPDPSYFKGSERPVESISWLDAVEFCLRLSQQTGKPYRLPSEAEWEYACRAGTTTPFHFGETITTDLANYNGDYTYGAGSKGVSREETTPVGSFGVANAFGLYDMHGNVWEWCADRWHSNYEGAPNDGSVWVDEEQNKNENHSQIRRVLRGGSWVNNPDYCRSAYRNGSDAGSSSNAFGFRVGCAAEWIQ